jgi:hypothetical protein
MLQFFGNFVTLNSFQGLSLGKAKVALLEEWMLKQVQHDEEGLS